MVSGAMDLQMSFGSLNLNSVGLTRPQQENVRAGLQQLLQRCDSLGPAQTWSRVSKCYLLPEHPFALHALLYKAVYRGWHTNLQGPAPVWLPSEDEAAQTNVAQFMQAFQGNQEWQHGRTSDPQTDWKLLYKISCSHPEVFWPAVLDHLKVPFHAQPHSMVEMLDNPDKIRWLPGARLNAAEAALKRHADTATAIVWAEEATPDKLARMTMAELRQQCCQVAAALVAAGLKPGDAVAINMPMTVHAVVIYLGIIYAGCTAVSIADSFAPSEISTRLQIAQTKAIFVQDVVLRGSRAHPLYQRVVQAQGPRAIVLPASRAQGLQVQLRQEDTSYENFLSQAEATEDYAPHIVDAYETCNILFSSGTTGQPKAIPWTHVTPLRCAVNAFFHHDVRVGDTVAWPTNLGWMMGPWLVFAALLNGATIALFQGSPLGRDFGTFVQQAGVTMLGVVPSIAKTWRTTDCMKGLKWEILRCFSSTGEASSPEDYHWLSAMAGYKPVMEYCGGTEIGGGFLSGTMVQPQAPSHFSTPTIGSRLALIDDQQVLFDSLTGQVGQHGGRSQAGVTGELALVPPLMGSSQRLLNKSHCQVYYEGMPKLPGTELPLRRHGDEVESLPGGFFVAHGRCDDTMNLGGIKVSSVELERVVIASVPAVVEAAAVALTPPGGGPEQLVMFLVLDKNGRTAAPPVEPPADSPVGIPSHKQSQKQGSNSRSQTGSEPQSTSAASQDRVQGPSKHSQAGGQQINLSPTLTQATSIAASAVETVQGAAAPLLAQAQSVVAPVTDKLQAAAASFAANMETAAAPAASQAQAIAGAIAADVVDAAAPVTEQVQAVASPLADKAKSALTGLAGQLVDAASTAYEAAGNSAIAAAQAAAPLYKQAKAAAADLAGQSRDAGTAAVQSAAPLLDKAQASVAKVAEQTTGRIWADEAGAVAKAAEGGAHVKDQVGGKVWAAGEQAKQAVSTTLARGLQSVQNVLSEAASSTVVTQVDRTARAAGQHDTEAVTGAEQSRQAAQPVHAKEASSASVSDVHELEQLKAACQRAIRTNLNPLFKLQRVLLRGTLPRTASNKVMRRVLRDELRQAQAKL